MISEEYLRESLLVFGGPGHDHGKKELFVEKMRKEDPTLVLSIIAKFFTDPDLDIRANAVTATLQIDKKLGLDLVLPLLESADWHMRYHICGLMNKFGDQRAVKPLLKILRNDIDPQVRSVAASGLKGIGDVSVIPELVESENNDHEIDRLGYAPSQSARQAISEILFQQVIEHVTINPDVKIERLYPEGGCLTGKITYLSDPMSTDRLYQDLPRDTFEYTSSWRIGSKSLHPFPFLVDVTYSLDEIVAKRTFVFSFGNGCWAIGIYLSPMKKDG